MKKLTSLLIASYILIGCATTQNQNIINQKLDSKQNKEIVLIKVLNDSRCPEGVQCIWAGEITFEVAAYENRNLVEQIQLTLSPNKEAAAINWFNKHLPQQKAQITKVSILPYPKKEKNIEPTEYYIQLQ
ncbi:hypothetical protein [Flavobacterium luminosum]|uniref:Lipoprotein n=1 Tax=Flavobacterium luminosum TaxID=2949086 RepID=A0ABT0TQ70_9FLAO|nr:hypothetical protein [Flavobacterium sp. HXWNR70]MCL9809633.1 hypothetical protein [Flavobacterium sp. HXWNR70]